MKYSPIPAIVLALLCLFAPACNTHKAVHQEEAQRIVVGMPELKPVSLDREFVCQIHSRRRVEIRASQRWYLQTVRIQAGQQVRAGEVMLKVGQNNAPLATESDLTEVKAPFDGIIDRLPEQEGSFVEMGTLLITLSDNNVMRGDFEVAKDLYLGYLADANERKDLEVKLRLDDGSIFKHAGEIGTVETDYDNETGTVPVRADFPNPEHLLRGGETGTVLIHRVLNDALVIPQRATFEMVGKRYVFVVDENDVAHRREIVIRSQLKDLLVIKTGLAADDRIILEGIRQVRDGDKVNYAFRPANQADAHLKE